MSIKNLVADAMVIALSFALLWHFSNIWQYGQFLIQEPNIVILSVETVILLIMLGFGIWKFVRDLKAKQADKNQSQRGY